MTSNKLIRTSRKNYCSNCGKYGHNIKKCDDPITSLGFICIKFSNLPINNNSFKKFLSKSYLDIDNYNFSHIDNINKLDILKKNIKFLMIQRKHSLSYIEFIRGKYSLSNYNQIEKLFKNMSQNEINLISELNFDNLWNSLWKKTSKNKAFQKEYKHSKELFENLILTEKMKYLLKIRPIYETPEWGFPKGRRNLFEKNIDCAIRELQEETTLTVDSIEVLNKINCSVEQYNGTNNTEYKHVYYLGYVDTDKIDDSYLESISNYEVGKIGWYDWEEAVGLIRGYYVEKIKVLNQIYFLFLNLYMEYISKEALEKFE